jgi:hypothetical protein
MLFLRLPSKKIYLWKQNKKPCMNLKLNKICFQQKSRTARQKISKTNSRGMAGAKASLAVLVSESKQAFKKKKFWTTLVLHSFLLNSSFIINLFMMQRVP